MDVEFLRHEFEDSHDGVIVKNKFKLGVRHIQMTYMLVCAATLGVLRGGTGVAVLALTDVTRRNDTYIQIYNWDSKIQGAIISSFLFGYALMVVPAELFFRRVGGKHVLTFVLVVSGAMTVAMPTIVSKGGWIAVCNAQLWLGASQACLTPSNQWLLARFLPPSEKGVFSILVHSGTLLGTIIGLPLSGVISEARLGWELVFFSQAMLAFSVACLWGLLTSSSPEQHQAMGDAEKEYIRESQSGFRQKALHIPWRCILESRPLWAAMCAHAATNVIFVFFLFGIPMYLHASGNSLRESSWKALLPFAALWLVRITTAPTVDWMCRVLRLSFRVNLTNLRKLINFIGTCGVIAGLSALPNLFRGWDALTVVVLIATLGMMGFQLSGFLEAYKDMSENYSGTLLVLSRGVASLFGACVPMTVGLILGDNLSDTKRWRTVFLTLGSIYIVCNAMYTIVGSSERQYWDSVAVKSKFAYHNTMIDTNHLELEEMSERQKQNDADIANTVI